MELRLIGIFHLICALLMLTNCVNGSLLNLWLMARCELGYNALYYNNYGCFCGKGGAGIVVDAIDRCCLNHDLCYFRSRTVGSCKKYQLYLDDYEWRCDHMLNLATCPAKENNQCEQDLCLCDWQLVKCWKSIPKPMFKPECPVIVSGGK